MAVATQLEVFGRDRAVEKMVLAGMDSRIILQKIAGQFGLEERMAYNYLSRAVKKLQDAAKIDRPLEITRANERFHKVYRDSMKVRTKTVYKILKERDEDGKIIGDKLVPCEEEIPPNHFAAIAAEKARAELLGLNAPKEFKGTLTFGFVGKRIEDLADAEWEEAKRQIQMKQLRLMDGMLIEAEFEEEQKEHENSESLPE